MARKKHEEHESHEPWLVSYADFIMLLFAFFVVMYSLSSVNEGTFRTVSDWIKAALNPIVSPASTSVPLTIGQNHALTVRSTIERAKEPSVRRLREIMRFLANETQVQITQQKALTNGDIVLTMPDTVLFRAGESALRPEAYPYIQAISDVLIDLDRDVRVEGSADPSSHTENITPENRAKNRRGEIVVQERTLTPQPIETTEPRTAKRTVIAEGVETEEQDGAVGAAEMLSRAGVRLLQADSRSGTDDLACKLAWFGEGTRPLTAQWLESCHAVVWG